MFFLKPISFLTISLLFQANDFLPVDEKPKRLFEGDIEGIDPDSFGDPRGAAQIPTQSRELWPYGIVPYVISPAYTDSEKAIILSGMKYLEDEVRVNGAYCIKFVPHTIETNWVNVYPGGGCSSFVGKFKILGPQNLSLARPGCLYNAIIAHEFLHALGFWHEQSRYDRDDYVTVNFENIQDGYENNFNKYNESQINDVKLPYDYDSVMHYGPKDFSKNGLETITPKNKSAIIGQRKYISKIDRMEVQRFYGCVEY